MTLLARSFICALPLLAAGAANAVMTTLPAAANNSSPVELPGYTDANVTGFEMINKLTVTASFVDASGVLISEARVWEDLDAADPGYSAGGRAVGSFWTLRQVGDTFFNPWELTVDSVANTGVAPLIQSLSFAFTVFDNEGVTFDRTTGNVGGSTPGTAPGRDFEVVSNSLLLDASTASPLYSNPVDSLSDGPGFVGDTYASLDVRFDTVVPGLLPDGYFIEFLQDTDTAVPTPGTLALATIGCTLATRRKRA